MSNRISSTVSTGSSPSTRRRPASVRRRRVHSQAAVRVETAGHHHRSRFRRNAARRKRLAQGRDVALAGQPGRPDRPRGHQESQESGRPTLKAAPRFPVILSTVRDFIGDSPIVSHAYRTSEISSIMSSRGLR